MHMAEIPYCDFSDRDYKRTLEIVYARRIFEAGPPQGWEVRRADNDRRLGWVISPRESGGSKLWVAYASDGAFRGDDTDDEGYILDKVPTTLTQRGDGWARISASTRRDVTEALLQHLSRQRATALGFGRHYAVTRHLADRPKLREWYMSGMVGDYPHDA